MLTALMRVGNTVIHEGKVWKIVDICRLPENDYLVLERTNCEDYVILRPIQQIIVEAHGDCLVTYNGSLRSLKARGINRANV